MNETIRQATVSDAQAMLDIYRPYVEDTAVTFELVAPSVEEFAQRIERALARHTWIVAVRDGEIIGYAYAGSVRPRAAYNHSVEMSIYLRQDERGHGLGRKLYEELESRLRAMGYLNVYSCITYSEDENDPFLTRASVGFHERMGFTHVGKFHDCGRKFDRWYSIVWMEKLLQR